MQQDFQQDKVFQSCLSSPENDMVVQFINILDIDEEFETTSMGTPSNKKILVKEACFPVLATENKKLFHMFNNPKVRYME